jgi:hypothetical protein
MNIDHDRYPLIIGADYYNETLNVIACLEEVEMFTNEGDAEIVLVTYSHGCQYKINYYTFTMYWKLMNKKVIRKNK